VTLLKETIAKGGEEVMGRIFFSKVKTSSLMRTAH